MRWSDSGESQDIGIYFRAPSATLPFRVLQSADT